MCGQQVEHELHTIRRRVMARQYRKARKGVKGVRRFFHDKSLAEVKDSPRLQSPLKEFIIGWSMVSKQSKVV